MKKILSLIALAAAALAGLAPTPLYVGRFAGDGTYISNVTAVALTTNTIHLQSSPSIGITTNSSTLNTPYLDSSVTNAWKLDGTNAAMGVVTYSNLPAAHLTGTVSPARLPGRLTPEMFGAVPGDGLDDSAAFVLLSAATTNNTWIDLGSGSFNIGWNKWRVWNVTNAVVSGNGALLESFPTNATCQLSLSNAADVAVLGLKFTTHNSEDAITNYTISIEVRNTVRTRVERCDFFDYYRALEITDSPDMSITRCSGVGARAWSSLADAQRTLTMGLVSVNDEYYVTNQGSPNMIISECAVTNTHSLVYQNWGYNIRVLNCIAIGTHDSSIYLCGTNMTVSGCSVYDAGKDSIKFSALERTNAGGYLVTGNYVQRAGVLKADGGVLIGCGTSFGIVEGNYLIHGPSVSTSALTAINIGSSNVIVGENFLRGWPSHSQGSLGVFLQHPIADNCSISGIYSISNTIGIYAASSSASDPIQNLAINNVRVWGGTGIYLGDELSETRLGSVSVRNSWFENCSRSLWMASVTNAVVEDNTCFNSPLAYIYGGTSNVWFRNNSVWGTEYGFRFFSTGWTNIFLDGNEWGDTTRPFGNPSQHANFVHGQSRSNVFTMPGYFGSLTSTQLIVPTFFTSPTNAPTDAFVLTATGTAGDSKWAVSTGTGSVQTNISYTAVTNAPWQREHAALTNVTTLDSNLYVGAFTGGGANLSNTVDLIASTGVTIVTNANKRSFTLSSTAAGSYTNDTGLPGVINAGATAVGTNLTALGTVGATNFTVTGTAYFPVTNQYAWFDANGIARGTNNGSGLTNIPFTGLSQAPQPAHARLTNWSNSVLGPYSDGVDLAGIYATTTDPADAWTYDGGGGNWWAGTNKGASVYAATFYGSGAGLTALPAAQVSGTFSTALLTTASTATNGPAQNELVAAQWVREMFSGSGKSYYATTNIDVTFTNKDLVTQYSTVNTFSPVVGDAGIRTYVGQTNGGYMGQIVTTNRFLELQGNATVNAYLSSAGGSANLCYIKPEIYYSYEKTNWYGDFDAAIQPITKGTTNLYTWITQNPTYTSTNAAGFYIQRRFKVVTQSTPTPSDITIHVGPLTPSHITLSSATALSGNVYAAADNTFTGSNTFTQPIQNTNGTGLIPMPTNAPTAADVLTASSATTAKWAAPAAASGGGGTNSGPITLTFSDTNVAVVAATPVGAVTNAVIPYRLTMTTNALIANPTGMLDGQRITIEFIQDATGSRIAYFGTDFAWGTDITGITLTTTASKRDYATFVYSNSKWNCLGFTRGY